MLNNQQQNIFDTLERLSVVEEQQEDEGQEETNQNKIVSIMLKPNCQRTYEENESVILHLIYQMIQKGNNNDLINKIPAVTLQTQSNIQICEVAEFQSLLPSFR